MLSNMKLFSLKRILPVIILAVATVAAAVLLSGAIHTVNIFDGQSRYTVKTLMGDPERALENLDLKDYKITSTSKSGKTTNIDLAYTFPVYITMGNETTEHKIIGGTVAEILNLAGHTPDEHDMIEPSLDTVITETAYIDYANIDYVSGTYTDAIPCTTDIVYSNTQAKGTTTLVSKGVDGLKQVSYTEKFVNGQPVERTVNNVTVLSNAVNGKKIVGTKAAAAPTVTTSNNVKAISTLTPASPIELDANGVPVNYTKKMTVGATAYTYTGFNCSTGVAPQPGYIAVNPKVIPYGTKMYIKSADGRFTYGYAVAADTGGFIKKYPTNVDLFMSTLSGCREFGRRNVEIYILP